MTDFVKFIRRDSKVQDDISQFIETQNKESYAAQSKLNENDLIQSNVFSQAIEIMVQTIGDMDIEIEQKDNKIIIFKKQDKNCS